MPLLADAGDWSYSGDPAASDKDLIRYLVQDVDNSVRLLTDSEITYEIAQWQPLVSSMYAIAAEVAERISVKFAGVTTVSADGVRVDLSDLSTRYQTVAGQLRAQAERGAVSDVIDMASLGVNQTWDPSIRPLSFGIGFQDNPEAGRQQYGGESVSAPDRDDWEAYGGP